MDYEKFLLENGRSLLGLEYLFGEDNNQNPPEEWETADFRILTVFLSPGPTRAVSNTFNSLNNIIKSTYGSEVFVDYAYLPPREDIPYYKNTSTPTLVGNVSHRPYRDYDLVMFSVAILPELYNIPFLFEHNKIPFGVKQRLRDEEIPILLFGGVCSPMMDILYGSVGDSDQCLVDAVYLGDAEVKLIEILAYLKNSKEISKAERLETLFNQFDCLYVPAIYKRDWSPHPDYGYEILSPTPESKRRFYARSNGMGHPGFDRKILNLSGDAVDSVDLDISHGCSGSGCCSFCYEGTVAGPWRERPLEDIVTMMNKAKEWGAPNSVSFYSYNLNYYSQFIDLIYESARRFSQLSLINMRADVVGARPDYFEISKLLGLARASMAVEGIGNRIRNGFLNKNLSLAQWTEAAKAVFKSRVAEMKNGLIYTGFETKEDFDESLKEFQSILDLRDQMGANTSVRVTITPLVYYPHTPLERKKRLTALQSLHDERSLGYYLRALRDMNIRSKINARGKSTFMEQFLLDYGQAGTEALIEVGREEPIYYGYLPKRSEDTLLRALYRKYGMIEPFLEEKPANAILWHEPVVCVNPKYLAKMSTAVDNFEGVRPCLVTPANVETSCNSCGLCKTKKEKALMTARVIHSTRNIEDVRHALYESRERYVIMVEAFLKRYFMSSVTFAHRLTAEMLRQSEEMRNAFIRVGKTSWNWVTNLGQRDFFTGKIYFPVYFSQDVGIPQLGELNKNIRSGYIASLHEIPLDANPLKFDFVNIYRLASQRVTSGLFRDSFRSFDDKILMAKRSVGRDLDVELTSVKLPYAPFVFDKGKETVYYMALPLQVNPYLFMQSVTGVSYKALLSDLKVNCMFCLSPVSVPCEKCGSSAFSTLDGKGQSVCPVCYMKALVRREKTQTQDSPGSGV